MRRVIAARLAEELGTDRACAGLNLYGWLAALNNRKPEHAKPAPPFEKALLSHPAVVAQRGPGMVKAALGELAASVPVGGTRKPRACEASHPPRLPARPWPAARDGRPQPLADWIASAHHDAARALRSAMTPRSPTSGQPWPRSRVASRRSPSSMAIGAHSPGVARRKGRDAMAYARRTVERALQHATTS